jgi:hypothetical protein
LLSLSFSLIATNGSRLYAGRVYRKYIYFFGSARAYHCEAKLSPALPTVQPDWSKGYVIHSIFILLKDCPKETLFFLIHG